MFSKKIFHDGELIVQKRAKQTMSAKMNSLAISDQIPRDAKQFIEQKMMVAAGSKDADGNIWASILFGLPGFVYVKNSRTLSIDMNKFYAPEDEPFLENIKLHSHIGLLMIDLESRLRFRVNGRMQSVSNEEFSIEVEQAYPNCPKYIQSRKIMLVDTLNKNRTGQSTNGHVLTEYHQSLIRQSDMFFVASANPEHGVDVSHRGGRPGFVEINSNKCLRVPDYAGNSLFNTLGNFQSYPFAGLVFIDFKRQQLLQLTGKATIIWDSEDINNKTGGTKRFWEFEINSWRESKIPFSASWKFIDYSPFNPKPSKQIDEQYLLLQVEKITQHTPRIKSFLFRKTHNSGNKNLPKFEPGAHLPVFVNIKNGHREIRNYSLISDCNDTTHYEIAVLEEPQGRGGSRYLHKKINEGNIIMVKSPCNEFPITKNAKHSVLIAGGIGITPIISMLRQLSLHKQSFEIHYAVRTHDDFALLDTIQLLAGTKLFCYTSQERNANPLNLHKLLAIPKIGTHVYVCGPGDMIEAVRDITEINGWQSEQIHFESFGAKDSVNDKSMDVHLNKSKKIIKVPADRSILDTLLDEGIDIPHQCKRGECSMCMTKVLNGEPYHRDLCLSEDQRKTSMCICVSRSYGDRLTLDL